MNLRAAARSGPSRLVQASLAFRRFARRAHGLALATALAAWVVLGGATAPIGPLTMLAAMLWLVLVVSRLRTKLKQTGESPLLVDVELGCLLAVALDAALLRFEGGVTGALSPAVYVLVALVASFARP